MKSKITAALAIMAAIVGLSNSVKAQSPEVPSSNAGQYTLSGDSLIGIDNRTADSDFAKFFTLEPNFANTNSNGNNVGDNIVDPYLGVWQISDGVQLQRVDEPLLPTNTSEVILQPAQSINGNDGLQVQLDLREQGR